MAGAWWTGCENFWLRDRESSPNSVYYEKQRTTGSSEKRGDPSRALKAAGRAAREVIMDFVARYEAMPIAELRDRVMDDLVRLYSLEHLDLQDFERRAGLVARASDRGEIEALVADLPVLPAEGGGRGPRYSARPMPADRTWRIASGASKPEDLSINIFGGSEFKGVWSAPRRLDSICIFGGTDIDLRMAAIPEEGLTISCLCVFGGVDVIVPPGMRVRVRGVGIFGGFERKGEASEDPDAPLLVVDGLSVFGGVTVKVKR
jgi:hypothetical protein